MLNPHRSVPRTIASLVRRLTTARAPPVANVRGPSILAPRGFSHGATIATPLQISPLSAVRLVETASRAYATTVTKTTTTTKKKTAAKKKPAAKKPAVKKAKKPKKKVVKKAKKPKKAAAKVATRPKVISFPSGRPISGYTLYIREVMDKKSGTPLSMAEASAHWRTLSESEKQTWNSRVEAENIARKQRYDQAIARLSPSELREENRKRRILAKKYTKSASPSKRRLIKDPNAPKRPLSAFIRYSMEHFTTGIPVVESSKQNGAAWKAMSEAQKRPYKEAYEAELAEYKKAMAAHYSH